MNEIEKLQVLLPHWIEHNQEHANEFRKWAAQAGEAGTDITNASQHLETANQFLQAAIEKLKGTSGTV